MPAGAALPAPGGGPARAAGGRHGPAGGGPRGRRGGDGRRRRGGAPAGPATGGRGGVAGGCLAPGGGRRGRRRVVEGELLQAARSPPAASLSPARVRDGARRRARPAASRRGGRGPAGRAGRRPLFDLLAMARAPRAAAPVESSWVGRARRAYRPVPLLRLTGLRYAPVVSVEGFAGVVTYLLDPDRSPVDGGERGARRPGPEAPRTTASPSRSATWPSAPGAGPDGAARQGRSRSAGGTRGADQGTAAVLAAAPGGCYSCDQDECEEPWGDHGTFNSVPSALPSRTGSPDRGST